MTQILWNSNAPHPRTHDHEMIELRLVDLGHARDERYLVREIRASWSAAAQQVVWKGFEDGIFSTPQEAMQNFETRKAARVGAGFGFTTVLN